MNRAARQDPSRPAVTLASGRPAPYVEAFLQAIDGHVPALFEHGTGLYVPDGYRFLPNPAMGEPLEFAPVRRRLREALVDTGQAFFQPGKEYSLSVFPHDSAYIGTLYDRAVAALGPLRESVDLLYSTSCLNVLPRGLHKGQGIEFLSSQTGYTPAEMLGVGDSELRPMPTQGLSNWCSTWPPGQVPTACGIFSPVLDSPCDKPSTGTQVVNRPSPAHAPVIQSPRAGPEVP
jgi:hypothetical protein